MRSTEDVGSLLEDIANNSLQLVFVKDVTEEPKAILEIVKALRERISAALRDKPLTDSQRRAIAVIMLYLDTCCL